MSQARPDFPYIHLPVTDSTSRYLSTLCAQRGDDVAELTTVCADYQTSGKGQRGNSWEAEPEKNLLFSFLVRPTFVDAKDQFVISQIVSLACKDELASHAPDLTIKWPNDLYYRDRKIGGILIEHELMGSHISRTICGIGLNINQTEFVSDAPNPVSLTQITGTTHDRDALLVGIVHRFAADYERLRADQTGTVRQGIATRYARSLYRRRGFHPYRDARGQFNARLLRVEDDGRLILEDDNGRLRSYLFKEVQIVL